VQPLNSTEEELCSEWRWRTEHKKTEEQTAQRHVCRKGMRKTEQRNATE
jgi:hypothetical protein